MIKMVIIIFCVIMGGMACGFWGIIFTSRKNQVKLKNLRNLSNKYQKMFLLSIQWIKLLQEGKNISDYLSEKGYRNVAIYGMSYLGEVLLNDFKSSKIEVKYAIDKNAENIYSDIDIISTDDIIPMVDMIIVTPIFYYQEIKQSLQKKTKIEIISLEDIISDIYRKYLLEDLERRYG